MRKIRLPLPVFILILATLISLASALGEWVGHPVAAVRQRRNDTVEQQQAAILYLRILSWVSRVTPHSTSRRENRDRSVPPVARIRKAVPPVGTANTA